MLVINNGYGKSGTTWIQRGLRYYFSFRGLDAGFQNPKLANTSIAPDKILSFIDQTDLQRNDYYSKSHWAANVPLSDDRLAQALLTFPSVVVINSIRNIGDSTVSWYHHQKRDGEARDFADWFWDVGVGFTHRYMSHHMSWASTAAPPFLFSYEALKRDPYTAFAAFLAHVGRADDRPAEAFNHHMDFRVNKSEANSRHMRKGIVGDRVNYLTPDMAAHIVQRFEDRRFYEKCGAYFERFGVNRADLALSEAPS
ncbi:MAG: sulfotransferase domain-containing protein [Pseudomonadota bacterium]